ncbi:hypothetical protein ABZ154_09050 [Streptomyces sp. NPDC006261]|uniref:hypothetical protein n=1 Tax=Streptomyces sp. NPDC006261 TaxID=3156739 RepID=UPI00339DD182
MKLRVHYRYGDRIRKATSSGNPFSTERLNSWSQTVSDVRRSDGMVFFEGFKPSDFAVPAQEIVLMELID